MKFGSVDAYIGAQPATVQTLLKRVRRAIRAAAPDALERISYQIPAYKSPNGAVLFFAAWKNHYALYPAKARLLAEFADDLANYEVKGSTIRLPLTGPVPVKLIERIAKFQLGAEPHAGDLPALKKAEVLMPGKKAHKPRNVENSGMHGVHQQTAKGRKSSGQTEGQFGRDMKGRKGQFTAAGDSPLIKK